MKHTPEGLERIRKSSAEREHSEESREKRRLAMTGRSFSDETKEKMSKAKKGRPSCRKGSNWKVVDGKRIWYFSDESIT